MWRAAGEEIILFADMNENVYTGNLSCQLRSEGLLMEEQTLRSTGQKAPHSHHTGQVATVGTFATPGIVCTNSYLSPHGAGVGDHRFQVHDFDAHTVLGIDYPKTVRPAGQALRCKVPQTVKKYNKVLKQLLIRHRSFEKLEHLQKNHQNLSASEFQLMFNQWDREVTRLMLGSEKRCNKLRYGSIEFSPVMGIWIRRLQAYRWIRRYHEGMVEHSGNLFRTCKRLNVPHPSTLIPEEVTSKVEECMQKLATLKVEAPKLRNDHLRSCMEVARSKGDSKKVKAIINILCSESTRRRWRSIRRTVNPDRGGAITRLKVPNEMEDRLYATREGVEFQAAEHRAAV
jgi:hypothetical protein